MNRTQKVDSMTLEETETKHAERLELVYQEYEKCLDLDVALSLVPMNQKERERLEIDEDLAARMVVCDARMKVSLVRDLRDIAEVAQNDGTKLAALRDLGEMFYPKRFKKSTQVDLTVSYKVIPRIEAGKEIK